MRNCLRLAVGPIVVWGALSAGALGDKGRESVTDLLPRAMKVLGEGTEIVLALRYRSYDHWYANFGYWVHDPNYMLYGKPGARLCALDMRTGKLRAILDDPNGSIRDPHVHYDGRTILFSWRKGEARNYNLYEIQADGSGLRQVTTGPQDDIEPIYLPNDNIVFISSRCNRFVPCWYTQVGIMYRCDRQGRNVVALSSNVEHENTPWMMPDGRLLYMRWEYVSRHVNYYHHLWTINPDGTAAMTYFGNMHPHRVMLDAKPVPGTNEVVSIFSPDHGREEHRGAVALVHGDTGPDEEGAVRVIAKGEQYRDPYPLDRDLFLVARQHDLLLLDAAGREQIIFSLPTGESTDPNVWIDGPNGRKLEGYPRYHRGDCPALSAAEVEIPRETAVRRGFRRCRLCQEGMQVHEPRPLVPRVREPVLAERWDSRASTGKLVLADIYHGRNLSGVRRGEIKALLVLEELPQPYSHNDHQGLTRALTLRRVLGTVPVEPDGSAYLEVPAMRSLYLAALDASGTAVKFMQSFLSLMPGETSGCVGCHEYRNETFGDLSSAKLAALRRPASVPARSRHVPEVFHYPRDIQPILDRHCVKCHSLDKPPPGGVVLTGDRGVDDKPRGCVFTLSYRSLFAAGQIAYNVEGYGNRPPRTLGSGASALMGKVNPSASLRAGGAHHDVKLSDGERETIRTWIDASAPYCGSTAWNAGGFESCSRELFPPRRGRDGRTTPAPVYDVAQRRCKGCHQLWKLKDRRMSSGAMFNLTRPELSPVLLAPLAKDAGGWDVCRPKAKSGKAPAAPADGKPVFTDKDDADYRTILAAIRAAKERLDQRTTPDMPNYRPDDQYVREMKRYGILPATLDPMKDAMDVFEIDRRYWRSFWPGGRADAPPRVPGMPVPASGGPSASKKRSP